jgi:hypothetical protein
VRQRWGPAGRLPPGRRATRCLLLRNCSPPPPTTPSRRCRPPAEIWQATSALPGSTGAAAVSRQQQQEAGAARARLAAIRRGVSLVRGRLALLQAGEGQGGGAAPAAARRPRAVQQLAHAIDKVRSATAGSRHMTQQAPPRGPAQLRAAARPQRRQPAAGPAADPGPRHPASGPPLSRAANGPHLSERCRRPPPQVDSGLASEREGHERQLLALQQQERRLELEVQEVVERYNAAVAAAPARAPLHEPVAALQASPARRADRAGAPRGAGVGGKGGVATPSQLLAACMAGAGGMGQPRLAALRQRWTACRVRSGQPGPTCPQQPPLPVWPCRATSAGRARPSAAALHPTAAPSSSAAAAALPEVEAFGWLWLHLALGRGAAARHAHDGPLSKAALQLLHISCKYAGRPAAPAGPGRSSS